MTKRKIAVALVVAMVSASTTVNAQQTVTLDQVTGAQTATEFIAIGGHKVGEAEFNQAVVGRTMDEGGWTWIINADGTHSSQAKDGSWTDSGGTWEFANNQYCRESPTDPGGCSDVYMIANYLRVSEADGTLAGWTVQVQ